MSDLPTMPDGPGLPADTPLTNRGCLTPKGTDQGEIQPVVFHPDYIKLTIFESFDVVRDLVERALIEPAGVVVDQWLDHGSGQHWEHIYEGPGPVMLLEPRRTIQTYIGVELKGHGCTFYPPQALQGFLQSVLASGLKWNGLRADLAFDHVLFTPHMVEAAIRAGNINSRCLKVKDRDWNDTEEGQTAYLGKRKDKAKTRRLRVYNMHGFNRCEGEFKQEWATKVIRSLANTPIDQWPHVMPGHIRGMVDFVDGSVNPRPDRCPLLDWWAEFVGNADRIRNLDEADRRQQADDDRTTAIGKSEGRIMRAARPLWPIIQAFGAKYLLERLDYHAKDRIRVSDEAFAKELKYYEYSGLAGLPKYDANTDDVPF